MKIHFLGTNGWYNTSTGETSCVLIDTAEGYIVLDAGNGFRKLDQHIADTRKPIYLFLSHFHLDHVYGLHILPKLKFPQGLTIIGQRGTKRRLRTLIERPWSGPLRKIPIPIRFHEVRPGRHAKPVPFSCRFLIHSDPCLGYRLTLEGKIVTYCTDTGLCDAAVELGTGADLLITECAWRQQNQMPAWPHLAPEDAAMIAHRANAKQLALMHFDANRYPLLTDRDEAQARARTIFAHTKAMRDDETLIL